MDELPDIVLDLSFGDERKTVRLSFDHWGAQAWQLYIGGYYCGRISHAGKEWVNQLHDNCLFTTDDYQLLVQLIENHLWGMLPG